MPSRAVLLAALAAVVLGAVLAGQAPDRARAAPRPPAGAEAGVLDLGARGPTVRALQRELRSRGFRVAADGIYGRGTRRAVSRFQRRLGLRVNGTVDRPLLWWLGLSVCRLPGPTTARGGRGGVLRLGAYGPQVCSLQRALARAGEPLAVDGGYGPLTRSAVRRAQRRLGLRATGVADRRLRARLRGPRARTRSAPARGRSRSARRAPACAGSRRPCGAGASRWRSTARTARAPAAPSPATSAGRGGA